MHTRNTTKKKRKGMSVGKALFVLELLTQEDTQLVLNYFCEYHHASYLDLLVHTQMDGSNLEDLLDQLMEAGILLENESVYGTEYELHFDRLRVIARLTKRLSVGVEKTVPVR